MKISMQWLNKYVEVTDFFDKPEELAVKLTFAGLEVEGIENQSEQYNQVVVGHILEKGKHPDADKLSLCQISTGAGVVHQIICGAQNHEQGDKVVTALPGAVLPGDFKIKKSKIRGVESNGMLCSEAELGLPADAKNKGIIILPEDTKVGQSYAEYAGLNDVILDISVTPNRADCLSHYGLAREISCLLDRPCKPPEVNFTESSSGSTKEEVSVEVKESDLCPRYTGRYVEGVTVEESPAWLKASLESVGINSINNIVDVTNYVMLELGQPLHAFDADAITDKKITVQMSIADEVFTTLDGSEIKLSGEELMICDGSNDGSNSLKAVALAGIVGGKNSGVTDQTKNLFIESAYFNMKQVRKTSRQLNIDTDSSYRFSRGVNPQQTVFALDRVCYLLQEISSGECFSDSYDIYPKVLSKKPILIDVGFVGQKIGYQVTAEEFLACMEKLGCEVSNEGADAFLVSPPAFRVDLEIAEDLVEEYARLNGYDKIPEKLPVMLNEPTAHVKEYGVEQLVHDSMGGIGYHQAVNHSFLNSDWMNEVLGREENLQGLGVEYFSNFIKVKNPLSEEFDAMRGAIAPGLIKNLLHNISYGNDFGRLYEVGQTFFKDSSDNLSDNSAGNLSYNEEKHLGLIAWGDSTDLWNKDVPPLVYQIKSDVESFLTGLKSKSWKWCVDGGKRTSNLAPDLLHSGQWSYLFYEGKSVGYIGTLHPKITEKHKVRVPVVVAEFNLEKLLAGQPRLAKVNVFSKFQSVERDLAFLMPEVLPVDSVMTEMKKSAGKFLNSISVFDVYRGKGLPEGQRSVAFRLTYQKPEDTLSEEEISGFQEKVINSVSQKYSIMVR